MAKLIFTVAALLLLFSLSHARTPSDLPNGRDASTTDNNQIPLTDADSVKDNTLRLPSERPETENVAESEPEILAAEEQKLPEEAEFAATIVSNEENTADASKSETAPLTFISFRPVGRHFPRRPFPLFRPGGHRCRHGHRQAKWTPRVHAAGEKDVETTYGDDMILDTGDELKFEHRPFRGGVRQIPARWASFRHGGPRFPFKHDDSDNMESERPRRHHRRHRHHDHDFELENEGEEHHREHNHGHEHEHEHEHKHRGGIFRSFRKFLNGF